VSPYIERGNPDPHSCAPPGRGSEDPPRRHDTWQCPDCNRLYYCSGWHMYVPGFPFPSWHRVPRSRCLSARWLRRLCATFGSPPL